MNKTYPSERHASRLRRATKRAAKREVDQRGDPHLRRNASSTVVSERPAGYQLLVVAAVNLWINKLATIFRGAQESSIREIQKAGDAFVQIVQDMDANAKLIPERLMTGGLHRWLLPAVAIAEGVQAAALWRVVQSLPLPLALLAAIAIATVTCFLAILVGVCVGMLVCDERDGPHELSPRHRRLAGAGAAVFGALVVVAAIVLAFVRGSVFLWLPLALVVAAIEVTFGVARYEARHHHERESLRKTKKKILKEGRGGCVALFQTREAAIGAGRAAVDQGKRVLRDGEVAFDNHWNTVHWKSPEVIPAVPQVQLPADAELMERLVVPLTPALKNVIDLFADGLAPTTQPLPPTRARLPELPA